MTAGFVLSIGALVAALPACAQEPSGEGSAADSAEVARALGGRDSWKTDFSRIAVPVDEIVSGGPPKDGIPAIDDPRFVTAGEADGWLDDREPVMVVELGGEAKAYPLQILIWHEIVNDEVGGRPVAVTFCPLCNTALAFDREVGGRVLDFGTTGRLRHSDLVMYDRQTESWWQQASGEGLVGEYVGTTLEFVPANMFAWGRAKALYPGLRVLSRETGYDRAYGRNPYRGYDTGEGPLPGFFEGRRDPRLPAMERVAAVSMGGDAWAAPFSALEEARVAPAEVGGTPIVVFWEPGAASALDASSIPAGRDVGQTAVFDRTVGERSLTFEWTGEAFRDRETGSTWDLRGRAVTGPLAGRQLRPVPHGNHFWFAWVVFRPDTELWSPE